MNNHELKEILKEKLSGKISLKDRQEIGTRFTNYLKRYGLDSPSFLVNYKSNDYHFNFTESQITGYKKGGYGSTRKGFLTKEKAIDFIAMIKAKFPDYPPPRLEYLTLEDKYMTYDDLLNHLEELKNQIEEHQKKIKALKKQYSTFEKKYLDNK